MEKLFKTTGKIYYFSGDCFKVKESKQHTASSHIIGKRRIVKFKIAEVPIVALCTLSNVKKIPSKISLNEETILFAGILHKEGEGEDICGGYDVLIEGSLDFLLQIIKQDIYLTEEQKDKIIKLKSE
jgi:hypothetical protein